MAIKISSFGKEEPKFGKISGLVGVVDSFDFGTTRNKLQKV